MRHRIQTQHGTDRLESTLCASRLATGDDRKQHLYNPNPKDCALCSPPPKWPTSWDPCVASQAHQVCIASLKHVLLCQRKSTTHYGANVSNFVIIYLLRWGVLRRSAMIKGVTINTINILRGLLKTNEHYPQAWWSKHEHSACPVPNGLKSFVNSAAKVAIAHCRRQSDRAEVFNPVIGRSKNDGTLRLGIYIGLTSTLTNCYFHWAWHLISRIYPAASARHAGPRTLAKPLLDLNRCRD